MLPPMPTWDSLHPLVIHFPIALPMVAPLFIVAGLFFGNNAKWFHITALLLIVMGTIGSFVAVSTGEAAGELAIRTPQIEAVLGRHEDMAETTRLVFSILAGIYALLVSVPLARRKPLSPKVMIPAHGAFVLLLGGGLLLLVNTAHLGGTLVHEYGVHAMLPLDPSSATVPATFESDDDD